MSNKRSVFVVSLLLVIAVVYGLVNTPATYAKDAAQAASRWCKGVNIVFMTGGHLGSGFADVVYNGAVQATADLGPTTQYVGSAWDLNTMITDFKTAAATHPDGIAVMGHPGDDAFKPLVDDAVKNGIIVTSQNTQLQKTEDAYRSVGFGYAGAILYDQSAALATKMIN